MRLLFISMALLSSVAAFSQENYQINLTEYVREIQNWEKHKNNMSLTFWIPTSYWEVALKDSPDISQEIINLITSAFKDYVFVCALDLNIDNDGIMSFTDEQELRSTISVEDSLGNVSFPLEKSQISADASTYSELFEPMFAQYLGQLGAGIHTYFFEMKDEQGENIIDEYKAGEFTINHSNKKFHFQLPLVTLLPPKICPIDSVEMKGNWNYCPFHGVKLQD
jgi:hypothetical protein